MRKHRMEVTDHSIECRELFIVDVEGDIEFEDVCWRYSRMQVHVRE